MNQRLKIIKLIFIIATVAIVLRLSYWQVVKAEDLTAMAESQHLLTHEVTAPRGKILFNDGSILASVKPTYLVFVQPDYIRQQIPDAVLEAYQQNFADQLAGTFFQLEKDQEKLVPDFSKEKESTSEATESAELKTELKEEEDKKRLEEIKNSILTALDRKLAWVSLARKVDFETKQKLEKLNLKGLGFEQSSARFYPEASSSAHLLGFVSSDVYSEEKGYFGIEGFYNGELRGSKGTVTSEKDAFGLPLLIGRYLNREPKPGKNLTLNIDRTVQHIVEERLRLGVEKYKAKVGSIVVMEPKTGAILAMASYPNYDPGNVLLYPKENFKNPITADGYEPGSTFKVLIMAAGLNEGVVKPDTICDYCNKPLEIGGYTIRTWNNKYQDNLTMTDAIIHSDNTGMVYVSRQLGFEKLYNYIDRFGFGKTTGIDVEDEMSPALRDKDSWYEIDQATASFGQGISTTALQIVRAVGALANGGKLMEPQIVKTITDDKDVHQIEPKVVDQVVSEEAAKQVTEMMIRAVDEGEAKFAKPKGYSIAGKTGTAQIPVAGHYDPNKTIASFVGFAPADDPKFVMLVRYQEPESSIFGAETAAPTFFEIARELFNYYGIAPSE